MQANRHIIPLTRVERKSDSFLNLLERMKTLNSEKEREQKPHHKSILVKTMTDNWQNDNLVSTDILMNMTDIKNGKKDSLIKTKDEQNNLKTLKTTLTKKKESSAIEIIQKKLDIMDEDKKKGMIRKCIVKEMIEKTER